MTGRCTAGPSDREISAAYDEGYAQGLVDERLQRPAGEAIISPPPPAPDPEPEPVRAPEREPQPAYYAPQPLYAEPDRDVYFANCSQARAAGYSNIRVGEPGYQRRMDRDGDGVACER